MSESQARPARWFYRRAGGLTVLAIALLLARFGVDRPSLVVVSTGAAAGAALAAGLLLGTGMRRRRIERGQR